MLEVSKGRLGLVSPLEGIGLLQKWIEWQVLFLSLEMNRTRVAMHPVSHCTSFRFFGFAIFKIALIFFGFASTPRPETTK